MAVLVTSGTAAAELLPAAAEANLARVPLLLLTADHDLLGMASDRVAVLRPRAGGGVDRYGPADVAERSPYRVPPDLVADVKALIGDATDGYVGVRGIGPSVGPDLVRRFGSLAALYDRIAEVEAVGVRNRLLAGAGTLHSRRPSTRRPAAWASATASERHPGSRRWALRT